MDRKILIVDDEPRTRAGIARVLENWMAGKYEIAQCASGVEALRWHDERQAQIVISDIRMPEMSGLELVEKLYHRLDRPIVILISGYSEFAYAQKAIQFGVVDYLLKPIDKKKLIEAVEQAIVRLEERSLVKTMSEMVDIKLLEKAHNHQYNPSIAEAISYIDAHVAEPITMKEIAELLHMNASYFSVLFKDQVGINFSEFLMRRRIQLAKELLLSTHDSITMIAEKTGYHTDKYFVKVFRSLTGISPAQYRKQQKHEHHTEI